MYLAEDIVVGLCNEGPLMSESMCSDPEQGPAGETWPFKDRVDRNSNDVTNQQRNAAIIPHYGLLPRSK